MHAFITSSLVYCLSTVGDPSLRGGNGIPPRCVYLDEMAADLDGQDWLDMDNIEQVKCQISFVIVLFLLICIFFLSKGLAKNDEILSSVSEAELISLTCMPHAKGL